MNTSTLRARQRFLASPLAFVFFLTTFLFATTATPAFADTGAGDALASGCAPLAENIKSIQIRAINDDSMSDEFFFAQSGSGRCTIASTAMMVRRAAFLDGNESWQDIDESFVAATGWSSAGVLNQFETAGYSIACVNIDSSAEALAALLDEHPEGVAVYDSSVPHAVLLTDYDEKTDTFYCADPAGYYSGKRIPVAQSWNGACRGGNQAAVISGFRSAWIITN